MNPVAPGRNPTGAGTNPAGAGTAVATIPAARARRAHTSGGEMSLEASYEELRDGSVLVELQRDLVRLSGPDAVSFMQGQCTQDISTLAGGDCADALVLDPRGKLDALARVTLSGAEEVLVDLDGGFAEALVERLRRFRIRVRAEVEVLGTRAFGWRGPRSPEAIASAAEASVVARVAWNAVVGWDLVGASLEVPPGPSRCAAGAWEAFRIEEGLPLMGAELDERTIPAEAGLVDRCVSFDKGCYTGQELVARLQARGSKVARRLCGLVVDLPGAGRARPTGDGAPPVERGSRVLVGSKQVGSVTSSAVSPISGAVVALAYLHRSVAPSSEVAVECAASSDLPALSIAAEVRDLPFRG